MRLFPVRSTKRGITCISSPAIIKDPGVTLSCLHNLKSSSRSRDLSLVLNTVLEYNVTGLWLKPSRDSTQNCALIQNDISCSQLGVSNDSADSIAENAW